MCKLIAALSRTGSRESPSADLNPRISGEPCTLCRWPWELCTWSPRVGAFTCNPWDVLDVGMEQLQLQPDLTFSLEISPLVILGTLNCPVRKCIFSITGWVWAISSSFSSFVSCGHAVLGYTELCCFCSQGELALRDAGMSALLARESVSCIIWEKTEVSCSVRAAHGQRNLRFSIQSFGVWFFFSLYHFYENNNTTNNNTNKNNSPESSHVRCRYLKTDYCPPRLRFRHPCFWAAGSCKGVAGKKNK